MRIITLEEHFLTPDFIEATRDQQHGPPPEFMQRMQPRLLDIGEGRLADMDKAGIDLQVLSLAANGLDRLDAATAKAVARDANDRLAAAVNAHPDRFAGFATLALQEPEDAAAELERCVKQLGFKGAMISGTQRGLFLDDPRFAPVFAMAESLDVPIYLHPAPPPDAVDKAYFSGLPGLMGPMLSIAGWGWHAETGLHALRLIVSGLFDRYPGLRMIIGHMGEDLPFSIARADSVLSRNAQHLKRTIAEYFQDHFWITTSGYFTNPPLACALEVSGEDKILFSIDYPFSSNETGRDFLDQMPLSEEVCNKIAHANAERLLKL